jgi:hypothetical protein
MMRPDIAAATSKLAQFLANPPSQVLEAVDHVYRYLRGTTNLDITYHADQRDELEGLKTVTGVITTQLTSGLQQVTATRPLMRQCHGNHANKTPLHLPQLKQSTPHNAARSKKQFTQASS